MEKRDKETTLFVFVPAILCATSDKLVANTRAMIARIEYKETFCENTETNKYEPCSLVCYVLSSRPIPAKSLQILANADANADHVADDFPFRRLYMPPFAKMYARLCDLSKSWPASWSISHDICNLGLVTRTFPDDYENTDSLTDHFVEPVRVACCEEGNPSPARIWNEMRGHYISQNVRETREMIYKYARGCNLFNTAFAAFICSRFLEGSTTRRILDCTAGWGDRLIAAHVALAQEYRGWDTNPALQDVYAAISREISTSCVTKLNWHIECAPFEDARDKFEDELREYFDLVLVCPPFFAQEVYRGPRTSSAVHNTREKWLSGFFEVLLRNARKGVRRDGRIVAYLRSDLTAWAKTYYLKFSDMEYCGQLGFQQKIHGQSPIRLANVWRKL